MFKGVTLYINSRSFKWSEAGITANSEADKEFLVNLLRDTNTNYNVLVKIINSNQRQNKQQQASATRQQ